MTATEARERVEYLRQQIRKECISYGEISELEALHQDGFVSDDDIELMAWAEGE